MEFAPQYPTYKVSYRKSPVKLSIDENATHNREQFGGYIFKIKLINNHPINTTEIKTFVVPHFPHLSWRYMSTNQKN